MRIREGEVLNIDIVCDSGMVVSVQTTGEDLLRNYGYNTKCNRCGRPGTPGTAGTKCGSCGFCEGIMTPEAGTFHKG